MQPSIGVAFSLKTQFGFVNSEFVYMHTNHPI